MYCNKDVSSGRMSINLDGIMKLSFESGDLHSEYYLVAKEM
jgi:hypothetical protein